MNKRMSLVAVLVSSSVFAVDGNPTVQRAVVSLKSRQLQEVPISCRAWQDPQWAVFLATHGQRFWASDAEGTWVVSQHRGYREGPYPQAAESGPTLYPEAKHIPVGGEVSQVVNAGLVLVSNHERALVYTGTEPAFEGMRIPGFGIQVGTYQYTTVLGASRTVPKFALIRCGPATTDEVIKYFKSGGTFGFTAPSEITCPKCAGLRLDAESKANKACPKCSGTGKTKHHLVHVLKW